MQTRKAQLKRAYSILSNAITRHKAENGVTDYWSYLRPGGANYAENARALYELLKPYLKDTINCSSSDSNKSHECKLASKVYSYKANSFDGKTSCWFGELAGSAVLGGGMAFSREWVYSGAAEIHVDVNGVQGPNRYGMDMFIFSLSKNGVLSPANGWAAGTSNRGGCSNPSAIWGMGGCTYKALYDENYWKNPAMK